MTSQSVQTIQSSPGQKGPGYASVSQSHFLEKLLNYDIPSRQSYAVPYQLANGNLLQNGQPLSASSLPRIGCMNNRAANHGDHFNQSSGQCQTHVIFGCTDSRAYNYNPRATGSYQGACWYAQPKLGCTDPQALNFDPTARQNDGTCVARVRGCTNVNAVNFTPRANTDDGSCIPFLTGCTDPKAKNFDANATIDSGACWYPKQGCADALSPSYDWRVMQQKPGSCCPTKVSRPDQQLPTGVPVPCTTCCD